MCQESRLQQVISICDSASSLVGRQMAIVSPKDGDHFVIIVGEGIFKSRLGKLSVSRVIVLLVFLMKVYVIDFLVACGRPSLSCNTNLL